MRHRRFRPRRCVSVAQVAVVAVGWTSVVACAVVGPTLLVISDEPSMPFWCVIGMAILGVVVATGLAAMTIPGYLNDQRLRRCPEPPTTGEVVVIGPRFSTGSVGAAVLGVLLAALPFLFSARRREAAAALGEPELLSEIGGLLSGEALLLAAALVCFDVALWEWTNRSRPFLWVSETELAYLPEQAGDGGRVGWDAVESLRHVPVRMRSRFDVWEIAVVDGRPLRVAVGNSTRGDPLELSTFVSRVAPHVRQ